MQRGKCSKAQNARGAREIAFAAYLFLTTQLLNGSLKRKTDNISTIVRRMTTAERERAVGLLTAIRIDYVARLNRPPIVECRRPK